MKYIDADELRAKIYRLIKTETSDPGNLWDEGFSTCGGEINNIIDSLQQEQPEGIEGFVHHCANVHYIVPNQKQLSARLKDFEDGAEVQVFINARKEK